MTDVVKKKVRELMKEKNLSNAELGRLLGDISGQRIGQYLSGVRVPKVDFYNKWEQVFGYRIESNVSRETMLQKDDAPKKIPFYDAIVVGGNAMMADQTPLSQPTEMVDPGTFLRQATGTLRVYGHSMFPKYPAGCVVAFKEVHDLDLIHFGEDYVIETSERRLIKRVQKCKDDNCIQVNSYNTVKDETGALINSPYSIPMKKIKRLFMVLGKVEIEASI